MGRACSTNGEKRIAYRILADSPALPGVLGALKPENMHLLYASLEITVATI
jgi:hypothetical protein